MSKIVHLHPPEPTLLKQLLDAIDDDVVKFPMFVFIRDDVVEVSFLSEIDPVKAVGLLRMATRAAEDWLMGLHDEE